jgi:hypothetical protein
MGKLIDALKTWNRKKSFRVLVLCSMAGAKENTAKVRKR